MKWDGSDSTWIKDVNIKKELTSTLKRGLHAGHSELIFLRWQTPGALKDYRNKSLLSLNNIEKWKLEGWI